jgi:hypothetical protein
LSLPDFGKESVAYLRQTLGLNPAVRARRPARSGPAKNAGAVIFAALVIIAVTVMRRAKLRERGSCRHTKHCTHGRGESPKLAE